MEVAFSARVSTSQQQHEGTRERQRRSRTQHMQPHGWSLLPEHAYIDDGVSGARLDRPALDRLRDAARRGACDAVVRLSPDRLARHYAPQWLWLEACEKMNTPLLCLQHPFGESPQGTLLPQMPGMIAEYERAQMAERPRRGRVAQARPGACIPWADQCYGYRSLPQRHGCTPQVRIAPVAATVIQDISRPLVAEPLRCRQLTKRLPASKTRPPTGKHTVWPPATGSAILPQRVYAGQARYNYRQPVLPQYRTPEDHQRQSLKTGRSSRAESEWGWCEAPALIRGERFENAQRPLPRHVATARKMSQPASRRYLLRTLVQGGECGLGLVCIRPLSVCKTSAYR